MNNLNCFLPLFENFWNFKLKCLQDGSFRHAKMRVPKVQDSLSWGKRKMPAQDINLSAAMSSLNKFSNNGSFMRDFMQKKNDDFSDPVDSLDAKNNRVVESNLVERSEEEASSVKPALTANQLAAKVLQRRMKGKHQEAEKLLVGNNFIFFVTLCVCR